MFEALRLAALRLHRKVDRVVSPPPSIWGREWDVLVILDGCRLDLFATLAGEYDWLPTPGSIRSVASSTTEWLPRTFDRYRKCAYITANVNTGVVFPGGVPVTHLDEVWRYAWDNDVGTVPPRPVTDAAIRYGRDSDPERMIVHYMQPHHPFIGRPLGDRGTSKQGTRFRKETPTVWERLEAGELDRATVWGAYADNVRLVLDDVALLRENLDADRMIISSDHGNAIGEYGQYGHKPGLGLSALVSVPWYPTTARDTHTHDPTTHQEIKPMDAHDQLAALGYR